MLRGTAVLRDTTHAEWQFGFLFLFVPDGSVLSERQFCYGYIVGRSRSLFMDTPGDISCFRTRVERL